MSIDRCNHRRHEFIRPKDGGRYQSKGRKITGSAPIVWRSR
ncbi:hypothetical protein [Phormidium pseudopriestleyi]|nr:hypothetical protein [Phormidium pseudopriestleyi]